MLMSALEHLHMMSRHSNSLETATAVIWCTMKIYVPKWSVYMHPFAMEMVEMVAILVHILPSGPTIGTIAPDYHVIKCPTLRITFMIKSPGTAPTGGGGAYN